MTPGELLRTAIDPALALLQRLAGIQVSDQARVLLLAIAGQESAWKYRRQIGGPAHGFWQFEKGGGVAGVLSHPSSRDKIKLVCAELGVECTTEAVYQAIVDNDVLAACMARLLLWTDPAPLPALGDALGGWGMYIRNWRPGAPHPETWSARYATAFDEVKA